MRTADTLASGLERKRRETKTGVSLAESEP